MIRIKNRLHPGISGGGKTVINHSWATGPRNLLKACSVYTDHCCEMRRAYGNVGAGKSWLEIDGVEVMDIHLDELEYPDHDPNHRHLCKTRMQKARELIAEVQSGGYANMMLHWGQL